jgi:hypothetical protein
VLWDGRLGAIAYKHSKDMGTGVCPFDHVGFDARVRAYPYSATSASENLFMVKGAPMDKIARVSQVKSCITFFLPTNFFFLSYRVCLPSDGGRRLDQLPWPP